MLDESGFSWGNERETTALDWPPLLTPELEEAARRPVAPRKAVAAATEAAAGIGFGDDGRIVIPADPDLTEAELRATSIDSMVGAAFLPDGAADDESTAADDDDVERPRRSSRSKGALIMVGTLVTIAGSAGYAANALGWRLPPALLESAQPMTTFFRGLTTERLVDLTEKLRSRLAELTNDPLPSGAPEAVLPIVGPMSDPHGAASDPMSLLEESPEQEVMTSLPTPASTSESPFASDEGRPAPVQAALLRDGHPHRAHGPSLAGESHPGVRSARRESSKSRGRH